MPPAKDGVRAAGGADVAVRCPPSEKDKKGFGGGLAADAGRIYVGTGYGTVVALDAQTAAAREVPERRCALADGAAERVFAVTNDGQVLPVGPTAQAWTPRHAERASLLSNASRRRRTRRVLSSGDLVARVADGKPAWSGRCAPRAGSSWRP
jgi:outer membrane protein assembly factor BamB